MVLAGFEKMTTFLNLPVDILLEEIVLHQYFGRHGKWDSFPLGLQILEEQQTFLNLQATSRQWKQLLGSSIRRAALCLADINLQNVGDWVWIGYDPQSYLANSFLSCCRGARRWSHKSTLGFLHRHWWVLS
jgi:hypothetical protein